MPPAAPALAWDWTITGAAGDTITLSDNPNLDIPAQWGGTNNAFINVNIEGRTPTLRVNLTSSGLGYTTYFGPAWDDQESQFQPNVSIGLSKTTKQTDYFANAFFSISDLETTLQQEDFVFVPVNGTQTNYGGSVGFTHRFDPLNSLSWSANYNATSYDPVSQDLFPSQLYNTSITWSHTMNRLHTVGPTVSFSYTNYDVDSFLPSPIAVFIPPLPDPPPDPLPDPFLFPPSSDDIPPPDVASIQATGWWNARLTKRLSLNATAGVGIFNQSYDGKSTFEYDGPIRWDPLLGDYEPLSIATLTVVPVWSVSLTDQVWDNSTFSFFASESTSPNSFGDLQTTFNIGMGFAHRINEFSDINLGFSYSENSGQVSSACTDPNDPCFFREDLASNTMDFSVVYNRNLWRYWSASLGYTFTRAKFNDTTADDGYANENSFSATVRREFTLLR